MSDIGRRIYKEEFPREGRLPGFSKGGREYCIYPHRCDITFKTVLVEIIKPDRLAGELFIRYNWSEMVEFEFYSPGEWQRFFASNEYRPCDATLSLIEFVLHHGLPAYYDPHLAGKTTW